MQNCNELRKPYGLPMVELTRTKLHNETFESTREPLQKQAQGHNDSSDAKSTTSNNGSDESRSVMRNILSSTTMVDGSFIRKQQAVFEAVPSDNKSTLTSIDYEMAGYDRPVLVRQSRLSEEQIRKRLDIFRKKSSAKYAKLARERVVGRMRKPLRDH